MPSETSAIRLIWRLFWRGLIGNRPSFFGNLKFSWIWAYNPYQEITDKIIAALENGVAPWVKPWASCGAPRNAVTGREYSGINTILLAMAPYANPLWLTYNQAKAVGATVRKGEHGTQVVFLVLSH